MNIKEAKDQIKNAMQAYFTTDSHDLFEIPIEKQRPVFLMGPPGIGKTAIMEQIASELGVALVSYSMTHHTRQSALGLPFIVKKTYAGKEYDVSEYTMSEIIASVYETMEQSGFTKGILFLDEINCVSETLAPAMLQFLQFKIFGRHRVPDGWIVVTAGNPPEYNKSVREFDIVTWDRLKRIDVEPDYDVWKEYAYRKGIHAAILTYLDIKKDDFYKVESTVEGKRFVTARGWDDLSQMIRLYEKHQFKVDEKLVSQYLQDPQIAKNFAIYYDLFNKYKTDYQVDRILAGKVGEDVKDRARAARFDERLALLGLLLDAVGEDIRAVTEEEQGLTELMDVLKYVLGDIAGSKMTPDQVMDKYIRATEGKRERARSAGSLSVEAQRTSRTLLDSLNQMRATLQTAEHPDDPKAASQLLKKEFDRLVNAMTKNAEKAGSKLSHLFTFAEEVFGDSQEVLILVTELTVNYHTARFISRFGCEEYFAHNKELLFYERQKDLILEVQRFGLDGEAPVGQ